MGTLLFLLKREMYFHASKMRITDRRADYQRTAAPGFHNPATSPVRSSFSARG